DFNPITEVLYRKYLVWVQVLCKVRGNKLWEPLNHILYLPKSSSFSPSSHLRSSSLVTREASLVASLEFFNTSSSTKIGQSTRRAKARASEGRESMLITWPSRSSQITA